ncbi:MAG: hypothetical protein M0Z64_08855 [Nitrospiraceae bacterium]|nr:hypothetical protein [Nitrospiraceae bacterium]
MRRIFFVTIIALILVYGIAMADAEKAIEGIRHSIERSALPQEAKASLLKKASDAVNAGIQSDDIAVIINRGLYRGVDSKTIEGFIDIATKTKGQNLPVSPVLDRIQQGLSKGVPPERILNVANNLAEKLNSANTILNNLIKEGIKANSAKEREDAVLSVARAMEKVIPENIIIQAGMRVKKHNYPISMFDRAIETLTNLVEGGMRVEQASKLVNKAMDKGYSEKDILRMEREIFSEIKEGKRMEDAARRMESAIDRGGFDRGHRGMEGGQMRGTGSGMGGSGMDGSGMGGGSNSSDPNWPGGSGMQRR